jgi:ribonuclease G
VNKELVINVTSGQVKVALLEDKRLVELHQEKNDSEYAVGDLYIGRLKKLVPGLNAAFVDVGFEKDGFLHYFDLGPLASNVQKYTRIVRNGGASTSSLADFKLDPDIDKGGNVRDVLKQGQEILVQIAKEPISTKGPRLSMELSIAGRYLVLVPFTDRISVSSKLRDRKEKERLKRLIQSIKPKNFGVIVRTVAKGKKVAELDRDLKNLLEKWDRAHNALQKVETLPQRVLGELDKTTSLLRDLLNESFNHIYVDDQNYFQELKTFLETIAPEKVDILKIYKGTKMNILDHFGVEKAIKSSFGRNVTMKSGAYLIIEHTEALHVIDVNSGNTAKKEVSQEDNALRVNLEAADEIARQLRLRDLGGIIVVDFIDMVKAENRKLLFQRMSEAMESDRSKHYILPPSKFGLVQITRQRVRPEMEIKTTEMIPNLEGGSMEVQATILIIDEIENKLERAILVEKEKVTAIKAHPFVEAYFTANKMKFQLKWFLKYKRWIKVLPRTSYPLMKYKIVNIHNEELDIS